MSISSPYVAIRIAINMASTSILGVAQAFLIAGQQLSITLTTPWPFIRASGVRNSISSLAVIGITPISPLAGISRLSGAQCWPLLGSWRKTAGWRK